MNTRHSRRWYLALLLPLLGLGCSDASAPAPFPESSDLEQRLAADLESPVFLELDGERAFLAPQAPTRVVAPPDESTVGDRIRDWVQLYSSSFGIAADVISVAGQARVPGGGFHVVLATNVPASVASSGYAVDVLLDGDGRLVGLTSYANASATLVPKITSEAAIATALRALPESPEPVSSSGTGDDDPVAKSAAPEARLVYSADGPNDARRLLYSVVVEDNVVWVDALSGEVTDVLPARSGLQGESSSWRYYSHFPYPDATKVRRVDYEQAAGRTVVLQRAAQAATFWSPEKSRIEVGYMTGFLKKGNDAKSTTITHQPLTAENVSKLDLETPAYFLGKKMPLWSGVGVDAMVEANRADEFFQKFLLASPARRMKVVNGLPLVTNEPIQVVVHANYYDSDDKTGQFFNNSCHVTGSTTLLFGDGYATLSDNPTDVRPVVLSLDVVGHEMTHMWLDTRNLAVEGQAIEEGLGDVVGQLLEHSVFQPLGEPTRPDRLGENSFVRTHGLRNLAQPEVGQANREAGDPSLQANHWTHRWCMLADRQGGAVLDRRGQPQIDLAKVRSRAERERCFYEASSIVGHAFYLMTFGGQNATSKVVVRNPIGWETAQPLWLAMLVRAPLAGELRALMPPTMLDLADRQLAMARAVSPDTANAVGCAWEAVGVLRSGTTQRFTGKACTLAAPISCAGRRDGVYCDELSPYAAVRCQGGAIAGAPPPCPTGKTCRPQGGFIGNPAIMTSDKALTCFSPAE
ncbi:MAG: hypothetical protein IPK71_03900 [Myxococcales bacterium]|nr:hypothetical protein [Myxococcales bacterium]